jgi:peroxiredoxin
MTDPHDPYTLPPNLPIPVDDGAAEHLPGLPIPALSLPSTQGETVDVAAAARRTLVLYCYPRTGRPGENPPSGWDEIPGARGCTPQACSFRDHHNELRQLGAHLLGVSAQPVEEQREFADRVNLPYPLLSDPQLTLALALDLPTFAAGPMRLYCRLTLIARHGRIDKIFYPVFPPDRDAAEVTNWLSRQSAAPRSQTT